MNEKKLMRMAKFLSVVLSPFYAPLWIILGLFSFSYLRMLPLGYKAFMLGMIYIFTVLIPRTGINIFRVFNKWTHWQLSLREHRHLPYILTVISYTTCLVLMTHIKAAMFFKGIVIAALVTQLICVVINAWWKISTHMVGMGGLVGALIAFSYLLYFNPAIPVCILILLSGALGTSRIILRQHTVAQVFVGFAVGFACTMFFILYNWFVDF